MTLSPKKPFFREALIRFCEGSWSYLNAIH